MTKKLSVIEVTSDGQYWDFDVTSFLDKKLKLGDPLSSLTFWVQGDTENYEKFECDSIRSDRPNPPKFEVVTSDIAVPTKASLKPPPASCSNVYPKETENPTASLPPATVAVDSAAEDEEEATATAASTDAVTTADAEDDEEEATTSATAMDDVTETGDDGSEPAATEGRLRSTTVAATSEEEEASTTPGGDNISEAHSNGKLPNKLWIFFALLILFSCLSVYLSVLSVHHKV